MTWLLLAVDVTLAVGLVVVALAMLFSQDHMQAIVLFITFGILMAITWTRLGAVDIALAEAAIGAGLTGALFLSALGATRSNHDVEEPEADTTRRSWDRWLGVGIVSVSLAAALVLVVDTMPLDQVGLAALARDSLPRSGVENPVTAVLLSYRAFDTLLELAVLMLAVAGAWSAVVPAPQHGMPPPEQLLVTTLRLVLPACVLVGGYLLWVGSHGPGGAFQAGAVLAGAGVLISMAEPLPERGWSLPAVRSVVALGPFLFGAIGVWTLVRGLPLLHYRDDVAKGTILLIEAVATLSISAALLTVFIAEPPRARGRR